MPRFKKLNGGYGSKSIDKYIIDWKSESKSNFQKSVKDFLFPHWKKFVCYEEMPLVGTRFFIDLVNLTFRVAIECDGRQHLEHVKFFQGKHPMGFLKQCSRDSDVAKWCELNDIKLIRVYEKDLPLSLKFFKETYNYDIANGFSLDED